MAGIVAAIGAPDDNLIESMLQKLHHRGPDNRFLMSLPNLTIREACLSLAVQQPPTCGMTGENCVALDGKIFNLRQLVKEKGVQDERQLLLDLYRENGTSFLPELDGMFALVVSVQGEEPLIARDPLGIKPLYFGYKNSTIYFASELKALVGVVENLKFFPPGHYFTPSEGFRRYINLGTENWSAIDPKEAADTIRKLLVESVLSQIPVETTPVSLLSGGIDSSIIAAVAARYVDNLRTYCVGMEGAGDLEAARIVSEFIGSRHQDFTYNKKDIEKILPEVIYYMESFDPSLIRSSVANYFAYGLIGNENRVVFSGEGGDELFGGYMYLKDLEGENKLHQELIGFFDGLHNVGLQRVDRMSMAHSKECRMPFLNMKLLNYAVALPPRLKIYGPDKIEKWILRKAFDGWLPEEILWRVKQEFSQGSGTVDVMGQIAAEKISDTEFQQERNAIDPPLRNKEELLYYRIFRQYFDDDAAVATVGRWVTT